MEHFGNTDGEPVRRTRFEQQMNDVRFNLIAMGDATSTMLNNAVTALLHNDVLLAESVMVHDDAVDDLETSIEEDALRILALQQPVLATDLRFVSLALKATTDIERVGDHCVNIAKTVRRMNRENIFYAPLVDMGRLSDIAVAMLRDAIAAFVHHDVQKARSVVERDDEADVLYHQFKGELRVVMLGGEPGKAMVRASHLLFVAHYLERICDHCVGIAEWVLFVETGYKGIK